MRPPFLVCPLAYCYGWYGRQFGGNLTCLSDICSGAQFSTRKDVRCIHVLAIVMVLQESCLHKSTHIGNTRGIIAPSYQKIRIFMYKYSPCGIIAFWRHKIPTYPRFVTLFLADRPGVLAGSLLYGVTFCLSIQDS